LVLGEAMIEHRCKNCTWWDNQHTSVERIPKKLNKGNLGFCRRRRAGSLRIDLHFYGVHPVMDGEEFCGEFKEESDGLPG